MSNIKRLVKKITELQLNEGLKGIHVSVDSNSTLTMEEVASGILNLIEGETVIDIDVF